jgi:hypothetical protein
LKPRETAILALSVVTAWVLLGATAHGDAIEPALEPTVGLNGAWKLERKENFEEYLKASGAPWWKRKLAQLGSSSMHQTIEIEGDHVEVTNKNPVETRTLNFIADGVTELTADSASGDTMTWTAYFEDAAFVIDGHGDLGHRVIRREISNGMMLMTIFNPDADVQCKLFFERTEAD